MTFTLSPGQASDDREGRKLLSLWRSPKPDAGLPLLMDRAYEGDTMRQMAREAALLPVVPPKRNRLTPWEYDRELTKRRNEIERLFRRLKAYRRLATRYDKLDLVFNAFIALALTCLALNCVNTT